MKKHNNSSYIRGAAVCVLSAMMVGCISAPQNASNIPAAAGQTIQKTAFSGVPENFGYYNSLNPDCTSAGLPIVVVSQAASHGSVEIQNGIESYSNFPSTNQRYECNKKKTPSVGVLYTSQKGFVGTDSFTLKRVAPQGDVLIQTYVIDVEQPPSAQASTARP